MIGQIITSFIAAAAFALLFNVPRRTLLQGGFVGALGWMLYISFLKISVDPVMATLISAFVVAVTSQFFAKLYKIPIIVFNVSGIIPLVPGGLAYDAMRSVVENEYEGAIELTAQAFMLSGSIAIGLVMSEVLNQIIRKAKR
jgi:uncharacterized membrane protein YjjB (DUF3815 family)